MRRALPLGGPWFWWALALLTACALLLPAALGLYWLRVATYALNFAIVAVAWDLLLGYGGQVHFAPAAVWGAGAYAASIAVASGRVNPWLACALAGAAGALLGALLAYPALRLRRIYLGLFTLAFGELLRLAAINEQEITRGALGLSLARIPLGPLMSSALSFYILTLALLLVVYLALRALVHSRVGLYLRAIRDDTEAAEARGIDSRRYIVLDFVIASTIMGLAGALFAYHNRYVSPDMLHIDYSFQFVVMALFGGVGTLAGPIVGALSITVLMEWLRNWESLRLVLLGSIVVLNVLFFPDGLVGRLAGILQRRRADAALQVRFAAAGAERRRQG